MGQYNTYICRYMKKSRVDFGTPISSRVLKFDQLNLWPDIFSLQKLIFREIAINFPGNGLILNLKFAVNSCVLLIKKR